VSGVVIKYFLIKVVIKYFLIKVVKRVTHDELVTLSKRT